MILKSEASSSSPPSPPCDCDTDPIEGLRRMFVDYAQGRSIRDGRDPATRPVFLRLHGVAHGRFEIRPDLPDDLRVGIFGQKDAYPAWVRFSSDVQPGRPDLKGTCGIAIKLFGVEGAKMLPPETDAVTQDFIFQNMDVFFTDTAKEMCEFTCQSLNGKGEEYLANHPTTARILAEMEKVVDSVLDTPYWSGVPFRFGDGRYVKYKLEPEQIPPGDDDTRPDNTSHDDPTYLRADLHRRLARGEARFRFLVQLRTDDEAMPLDRATVRWSEKDSPPIHVATLVLPRQDLDTRNQSEYGENLAFNIWRAMAENEPVGSIAEARKVVYRASAKSRRDVNGLPLGEPATPRPAEWEPGVPYPQGKDQTIVRAAIHPAIGIARVGDSAEKTYLGPEVYPTPPLPPGSYRDDTGALARQSARFRIYGYNAAGEVVRELTADWADIRWSSHLANHKASWYQWIIALDIPEAARTTAPLRNPKVKGDDRKALAIDGGEISIRGKGTCGDSYAFRGQFLGTEVYLGELRTDDKGRLLVLPGHGVSASPDNTPIYDPENNPNAFINADGWYDDVCDGPVTAEVTIEGRSIPCESAWVLSAPPDYAPNVVGVRTLYDLLNDLYIQAEWLDFPETLSFRHHVYPILHRLTGLGWVNKGYEVQFGLSGPYPFSAPDFVARLASNGKESAELRRQVFHNFRDPAGDNPDQLSWAWLYGDAMEVPAGDSPRQNAAVSPTQYRILKLWAAGVFESDWDEPYEPPTDLGKVPLAEQPATLDRAALEYALADAFHPGCEVTWPVRHLTLWKSPFRLKHRPADVPEPDYGPVMTQKIALSADGPLHAQGPGDLTRWMGLPWQADTAYCRSGYDAAYDPYIPTFWPATVPNQVMTPEGYEAVMKAATPEERAAAFARRFAWVQPLDPDGKATTSEEMERMVKIFGSMGFLEQRPGPENDPNVPSKLMVASFGKGVAEQEVDSRAKARLQAKAPEKAALKAIALKATSAAHVDAAEALRKAAPSDTGWSSPEKARQAPLPVKRSDR